MVDPLRGQDAVKTSVGQLAHCPEDLELFMQAYLDSEPWRADPVVLNMPWKNGYDNDRKPERPCFATAYGSEAVSLPHRWRLANQLRP